MFFSNCSELSLLELLSTSPFRKEIQKTHTAFDFVQKVHCSDLPFVCRVGSGGSVFCGAGLCWVPCSGAGAPQ